jgi:hypothetical protein
MKFTIDRSKWLRGEGSYASKLLRGSDGKMCCLGQLGLACGLTAEEITNKGSPYQVGGISARETWSRQVKEAGLLFTIDDMSPYCFELMEVNDETDANDDYREGRLTDLFAKMGIEVEFIN